MDPADLTPVLGDLTENIDDLTNALQPLLQTSLASSTSTLPLLDRAKLYTLATYAIDSLLFSSLRLNGVDAKQHPVFTEIARVRQYFEKIKIAESQGAGTGAQRTVTLNKQAANRFIKHNLAAGAAYGQGKAGTSTQFDQQKEQAVQDRLASESISKKRKFGDLDAAVRRQGKDSSDESSDDISDSEGEDQSSGSRKEIPQAPKAMTTAKGPRAMTSDGPWKVTPLPKQKGKAKKNAKVDPGSGQKKKKKRKNKAKSGGQKGKNGGPS